MSFSTLLGVNILLLLPVYVRLYIFIIPELTEHVELASYSSGEIYAPIRIELNIGEKVELPKSFASS